MDFLIGGAIGFVLGGAFWVPVWTFIKERFFPATVLPTTKTDQTPTSKQPPT